MEDLFVLDVANVVLDVQWLQQLGKVTMNYKQLTMEFTINKNQVMLQGEVQLGDLSFLASGLRQMVARKEITCCYQLQGPESTPQGR